MFSSTHSPSEPIHSYSLWKLISSYWSCYVNQHQRVSTINVIRVLCLMASKLYSFCKQNEADSSFIHTYTITPQAPSRKSAEICHFDSKVCVYNESISIVCSPLEYLQQVTSVETSCSRMW